MSGDATIIASGALTIAANAVSNAKLAQMATLTIKGNNTGGTANALDLTGTQVTAMLANFVGDSGSGGTKGLVPAPASGDSAANKFLKADGVWTVPTGAGDVSGPASSTDNGFARFDGITGKVIKNSAALLVNADISASAAIAYSKLNLTGSIVDADIAAVAAIAFSKLEGLASGNILVGSALNVVTSVAVSGAISMSNAGLTAYAGTVPLNKGGTGQTTKAPAFDALSPMSAAGDMIYGGASGTGTRLPNGTQAQYLATPGSTGAPLWNTFVPPTIQKFTSGSGTYNKNYAFIVSGANATVGATYTNNAVTYTVYATVASSNLVYMSGSGAPTASGTLTKASGTGDASITFALSVAPSYLRVRMVGGGGGGCGSGSSGLGTGGTGGTTTFGSQLSAAGGVGATGSQSGGIGGTATLGTGPIGTALSGGGGGAAGLSSSGSLVGSGSGGNSAFGGGGAGIMAFATGTVGAANTGGGGAGGGSNGAIYAGSGGGAGGFVDAIISPVSATYSFSVGASGTGGANGVAGASGGAGGLGYIEITEKYQ